MDDKWMDRQRQIDREMDDRWTVIHPYAKDIARGQMDGWIDR